MAYYIGQYRMPEYVLVRDELQDAELEVRELTRLLAEAKERRNRLGGLEEQDSTLDWILGILGLQIKRD